MTEEEILERNAEVIRTLDQVAEIGGEEERRAALQARLELRGHYRQEADRIERG